MTSPFHWRISWDLPHYLCLLGPSSPWTTDWHSASDRCQSWHLMQCPWRRGHWIHPPKKNQVISTRSKSWCPGLHPNDIEDKAHLRILFTGQMVSMDWLNAFWDVVHLGMKGGGPLLLEILGSAISLLLGRNKNIRNEWNQQSDTARMPRCSFCAKSCGFISEPGQSQYHVVG